MIISVHWCFSSHWFLFFLRAPFCTFEQIIDQKIELKVESKIGSLSNIKHKPGGGDKKVFNDVEYLRQTSANVQSSNVSRTSSRRESTTQVKQIDKKNTDRQKYRQIYTAIFSLAWIRFDVVSLSRIYCNPKCVKFMFSSN